MEFLKSLQKNRLYVLVGSVLGAIAAFMPFVTANVFGAGFSMAGIEGDGKLTLLCCVVIAVVALLGDRTQALTQTSRRVILGAIVVFWIVLFLLMLSKQNNDFGRLVSFGLGYYLTLISGVLMPVGLFTKVDVVAKFLKKAEQSENIVADEVKEEVREFNEQQVSDAADSSDDADAGE